MPTVATLKPTIQVLGKAEREPWQRASIAPKRMRGTTLQNARRELFDREPLCRECRKHDRTTAATIRDHIVPLAEGGTDDDSNIQPLCQDCSDLKTQQESKRGRYGA